jgi:tripartite-type tricarboxylate transporter receptor subunit TctC
VLEQLSAQIRQPIIIENRAGAGGTIGSAVVAKSEPDGYTILAHGAAHTIAPALYKSLPYHPARDFIAVAPVGISPSVLVVSPGKSMTSAAELATAAKARPGTLNFSSVGVGSATHLSAERFVSSAGIQALHVPFKGGAEATLEVIAGRVDFFFGPVALVLPHIRNGKLRALAVNGSSRSNGRIPHRSVANAVRASSARANRDENDRGLPGLPGLLFYLKSITRSGGGCLLF